MRDVSEDGPELEKRALALLEASYELQSEDRLSWLKRQTADSPDLFARTLQLINADSLIGTVFRTGGAGADFGDGPGVDAPERAGAYRISGTIGQGGMGAVYLAERDQGDFDHQVAIKVVHPGAFSDALAERFVHERQILAGLNHPNIARLYDGGSLDDGSPFLVMEYVDGTPILDWATTQKTGLRDRLRLFIQVCSAVEYAHQNLIIHRDISPSNILVTAEDEAKLIDFGIARQQSETVSPSQHKADSRTHTPGYSAPERMAGADSNTLTDIYSLGVLLRDLLEDQSPPADLRAIMDKAAAHNPQDRYTSAGLLINDVDRFLDGYSVGAHDGGVGYQLGKYLKRHRWSVTAASIALSALVLALGVTRIQYERAQSARERADARFEQARSLSRNLVFDVYDSFAEISGTLEPRGELADLVHTYVSVLAADREAPDDVLMDVAVMSARLGDLYGGVGLSNLGDTGKSWDALADAEAAFESLLVRDPANTEALSELMLVKRHQSMQALHYRLDPAAAAVHNQAVLERSAAGAALSDENEQILLRHFWSARTDRLQILVEQGEFDTALTEVRLWRSELDEDMFARLGGGEEMATYLARQEADILGEVGRSAEALAPLKYAEAYRQKQLEAAPDNYYELTQLMVVYTSLSRIHGERGEDSKELDYAEKAVALARDIASRDETDAGGPEGLNAALDRLAAAEMEAGNVSSAFAHATEAVQLARGLRAEFPGDLYYEEILFSSLLTLSEASTHDIESACSAASEAEALYGVIRENGVSSRRLKEKGEVHLPAALTEYCN